MATTANTKKNKGFQSKVGEPTDPAVDRRVREKLVTARIALLLKKSFFGNLATRMTLLNADEWCPTAATDGRNFYYNSYFVDALSQGETEFLVGHEVLHNVFDHLGRYGNRDPQLANIAADYAVNQVLLDENVGTRITTVPILHDYKYKGKSFEEIYDDLYENADKINIEDLLDQLLDEHMDGDDGKDGEGDGEEGKDHREGGNGNGEKPGGNGKGKGKPKLTDEERKQIRDEMKEAILGAAHAAGAGNVPAGVKRMIQELTEPKIDWRELLQQQIQSTIKSDFSWQRPNRKAWHTDAILPGMINEETIDICIAIDMSGSITNAMGKDMLSEIQGIMEQYTNYRIMVWCFDTAVYNPQVYTSDCGEDMTEYEVKGGGGTDFMCNWEWMKAEDVAPKKFIMFTDGYPYGSWGDEHYCDTVFIIHGTETIEPPFGTWAYYTKEAKR